MITKYEILIWKVIIAFKQDCIPKKIYNKLMKDLQLLKKKEDELSDEYNSLEEMYDYYIRSDEVHSNWDWIPANF